MPRGVNGFQSQSCSFEPASHLRARDETGLLKDRPSAAQHDKVRDRLNAKARRCLRAVLGIHFQNQGPARHLAGQSMNFGRGHAAGPAPCRPEIGQNRHPRFGDDLSEGIIVDIQRFVHCRQRRFAGAASAGVGKMPCGNAVSFPASRAFSDDRERQLPSPRLPYHFHVEVAQALRRAGEDSRRRLPVTQHFPVQKILEVGIDSPAGQIGQS